MQVLNIFGDGQNCQNQTFKQLYQLYKSKYEKSFFGKTFTVMLFHMYQVFSSLLGHLHFSLHFFSTFMEQLFLNHPISVYDILDIPFFPKDQELSVAICPANFFIPFLIDCFQTFTHLQRLHASREREREREANRQTNRQTDEAEKRFLVTVLRKIWGDSKKVVPKIWRKNAMKNEDDLVES